MNSKQILLLQLQLASLDGHEHTQIKAIEKMLPDHRVTVLTRQGFGLSDRLDISDLMDLFPAAGNAAGQDGFDTALKKAVEALGAGASDLLLVPSAGPHEIEMLVRFMERNAATAFPMVKLRVLGDDVLEQLDSELLARLRGLCESRRFSLHTETEELQSRLSEHYGLPEEKPIVLPCTLLPGHQDIIGLTRSPESEITIGVLGRQRSEKGSYRIPGILNHLRVLTARSDRSARIRIVYQAVKTKRIRRFILGLKTRLSERINPDVRIEFLDSGMSDAEFRQRVLESDILLLPYNTRRYRYSGSGIIIDGVLGLKPIVYSRGMAMQDLLAHGNAEAAETDREFAEKLLQVATDYSRYKQCAVNASGHLEKLIVRSSRTLTDR